MRLRALTIAATVALLAFSGCVSSKKYAALQTEHDTLKRDYNASQVELAETRANGKSLESLLAQARANNEELKRNYAALQKSLDNSISQNTQGNVNISKLVDEINASNRYIKQLVQAKSKSDSLNLALTTKLTRSLDANEMQEVNVKVLKGVVYISLADNMLFQSGSYEVNERAMETLGKSQKSSRTMTIMTCSSKVTPILCPSTAQISATTGISVHCVQVRSYRYFKRISTSILHA